MKMNKKDKEKKLNDELLSLFLYLLKYSQSKQFKELLKLYKINRDLYKDRVNRIIVKYTKNNQFKINNSELNREMKKLVSELNSVAKNLYKQENEVLLYLLPLVYTKSYKKSYKILKGVKVNSIEGADTNLNINKKEIDKVVINHKYNNSNLTILDRNKRNKEILISKLNKKTKDLLKKGKSDKLNKEIDKLFGYGAYISTRLLETETDRLFNYGSLQAYKDSGIKKVRWNSVLEKNTCSICANLDGTVFNRGEEPQIPLHTACKCWLEPVL